MESVREGGRKGVTSQLAHGIVDRADLLSEVRRISDLGDLLRGLVEAHEGHGLGREEGDGAVAHALIYLRAL